MSPERFQLIKTFDDRTGVHLVIRISLQAMELLDGTDCTEKEAQQIYNTAHNVMRKVHDCWDKFEEYRQKESALMVPPKRLPSSPNTEAIAYQASIELVNFLENFLYQAKSSLDVAVKYLRILLGKKRIAVQTYSKEGRAVIKELERKTPMKLKRRVDLLIQFIRDNESWIKELVDLRDKANHFLQDFEGFGDFIVATTEEGQIRPMHSPDKTYLRYMEEIWKRLVLFHEDFVALAINLRVLEGVHVFAPDSTGQFDRKWFLGFELASAGIAERLQFCGPDILAWRGRLKRPKESPDHKVRGILSSQIVSPEVKRLVRQFTGRAGIALLIGPWPAPEKETFRGIIKLDAKNQVLIALNKDLAANPEELNATLKSLITLTWLRVIDGHFVPRAIGKNYLIMDKELEHSDVVRKFGVLVEQQSVWKRNTAEGLQLVNKQQINRMMKCVHDISEVMETGGDICLQSSLLGVDLNKVFDYNHVWLYVDYGLFQEAEAVAVKRFDKLFASVLPREYSFACRIRQLLQRYNYECKEEHNEALACLFDEVGLKRKVVLEDWSVA